jgi:L-glutamine-phosphate cytidylyltransferase
MRGLILAAGRTSHMGEIGDQQPKCMVPLAGATLIARQIAALRGGGATEIGVVRGFRAEMIDYPDITYFENERWADTNTVMSLAAANAWLRSGPVIVSDSDIFYRQELVHRLGSVRGSLVVAYDRRWRDLWTRRFADPLTGAETFRRGGAGNLLEIGGKTTTIDEIEGRYVGLLKFTPSAWQAVDTVLAELDAPTRDQLSMTGLLRRLLAMKLVAIGTVGTDGQWGKIDSPGDVELYERMLADGQLSLEG